MSHPDAMTDAIARLLEQSGCAPAEARALAEKAASVSRAVSPGCDYGPLHPQDLARIWQQAARAGRRRLVLEVVAEADALDDDTGRVNVRVLEADTWPEWTPEHTAQTAATDALLRHAPAPAGWSESDYMARGLDCPDVWDGEDLDVDPASVAQMPGAREITPGVFLVPGRLETEEEAEARARAEELN